MTKEGGWVFLLLAGCGGEEAEALPTSGSLGVLTYNVHGLPSGITGDDTPARIAAIAPLLPAFDLVGLQEAWIAEDYATLISGSPHTTQEYFDQKVDPERAYGAGLAVLGPAPVALLHEQHYTTCYGLLDGASDCLASKGFQLLRFEVGAGSIDVYNTHLEAGGGEADIAARAEHVRELLVAMEQLSGPRAILLMGDTNLDGDDPDDQPLIDALLASGLADACDTLACPEPGRIDRFLLRDGENMALTPSNWAVSAAFFDDAGVPLSDHDPIELRVDWQVP
jgi:endonuclease/exonuclease/phosphatase family metal-dependent hydrolase